MSSCIRSISGRILAEAKPRGRDRRKEWRETPETRCGGEALTHGVVSPETPESLARAIGDLCVADRHFPATGEIEYGELTFFGDTRYSDRRAGYARSARFARRSASFGRS